jgi:hypothetical protein
VIACNSSAQRSLTRCVLKLCYHDPLLTGLGQTLTSHAICGCTTVSLTYTRCVKAQVGCHEPVYLPSFSPLPNATLQPCELETQIYNAHTFPYQNGVSVQFLYSLTAKTSSVSSSANPFCNTMHEYAACPLQDRHLTPARLNQGSNDRQPHHGLTEGSEDAQNRSSLDLSRGYRNDNLASSTSSLAQAESLDTPGQSSPSEAFPPPTRRLGRNFSGGYSRWKTSWRLQTVIIGFFLLGICIPDPQPINH